MQGFITQGKKLKLEHETDDEDVGDVTDEDEAADIDQEAAAAVLQEKSAEGGDGPSTTAPTTTDTPPVKKKEKKPKKVLVEQVQGLTLNMFPRYNVTDFQLEMESQSQLKVSMILSFRSSSPNDMFHDHKHDQISASFLSNLLYVRKGGIRLSDLVID